MLENDLPLADAFGAGRADIILAEDLQHGSLGQAGDIAHGGEHQRHDRQHIGLVVRGKDREPVQLQAEDQQQQRRHDKARHGNEQRREEDDHAVGRFCPVQGGDAAETDTQDDGEQRGIAAQLGGNGKGIKDRSGDFTAGLGGDAEIPLHQAFEIKDELPPDGLVQVETLLQHGLYGGGGRLLLGERTAGDRVHSKERDGRNDKNRQQRKQDPLADIASCIIGKEQRAGDQHQYNAEQDLFCQDGQEEPPCGKDCQ